MFIDPTGLVGQTILDYYYGQGYTGISVNKDDYAIFYKTDKKENMTYAYWTNGKSVTFPSSVNGVVNGTAKVLTPTDNWGGAGKGGYPAGVQKDGDRYKVAVGPKVLDANYPDSGKIWSDDFNNMNILVVLEHKTTGEIKSLNVLQLI